MELGKNSYRKHHVRPLKASILSVDRVQNEGLKRQNTLRKRRELEKSSLSRQLLQKVNDDGIELIKEANDRQHLGLALVINSGGNYLTLRGAARVVHHYLVCSMSSIDDASAGYVRVTCQRSSANVRSGTTTR